MPMTPREMIKHLKKNGFEEISQNGSHVKIVCGEEVELIDSFFQSAPADARPLWFLGKSLELLSTADVAYFAPGWKDARGCKIEHLCAVEYGIDRIEKLILHRCKTGRKEYLC